MWGRYKAQRERPMQWCFDLHQHVTHSSSSKVKIVLLRTQYKSKQVWGIKPDQQTISVVWAVRKLYQLDKERPLPFLTRLLLYFRSSLSGSEVSILGLFPVHIDNTVSYSQPILRLSSYFPESRCAPHSWPFPLLPAPQSALIYGV